MIDRGALVLAVHVEGRYRGIARAPLDAQPFTGRKGKALARRYADALVAGDGVVEDLDDAIAMLDDATAMGLTGLEVIVFEVPQEPLPAPGSLPMAPTPPADGLVLLGFDVVEPIEPYDSPLAVSQPSLALNAAGLFDRRLDAEAFARSCDGSEAHEDPLVVARIWAIAR